MTDETKPVKAPKGSVCGTCIKFDNGQCGHLLKFIEATKAKGIPALSGCGQHQAPPKETA